MKPQPLLIDTNLLILFVVGTASREYIEKHKKLSHFIAKDYDTLVRIISNAPSVLVTPNTLTETSNLAACIGEPARGEVLETLRTIADTCSEVYIPSKLAASRKEFLRLGLTDSAVLCAISGEVMLLTADLDLYLAAVAVGDAAVNFNHIRDEYL